MGYGLIQIDHTQLNDAIQYLYRVILKDYWDAERHYVDEQYQTIPFPFKEIAMPDFKIQLAWSSEQLIDYLYTWSAIKHYIQQNDTDPLNRIRALCSSDQSFQIEFPILLRVGTLG